MRNYAQVDLRNMKVVVIAQSQNIMVEVDELDNRLLGCSYDPDTGAFTGYKITLTTNKPYIMADGTETVRVTASIKTWDEQDASGVFTDPIMFIVDGTPKLITKKADGYYVDFKTAAAGTKIVRTQDDKFINQGSVSILAVEVEAAE